MVPPEFRRKFTIISGSISLIQAVVWSLVAIYSIGVFKCAFPFPFFNNSNTVSTWDLFYITYFYGGCNALTAFNLTSIPQSASNTEIWMIVYSLISSIWIPCCILLIAAAAGEVRGIYGSYLYYPWITVTAVLIVVDLIAAGLHLSDLFKTLNADAYAEFLSGKQWTNLTQHSSTNVTTYLPALFLTLFFCRGAVLWIAHIVMLYTIVKACNSVAMYKTKYQQTVSLTNSSSSHRKWFNVFCQGPDPSLVIERSRSQRHNEVGIDSPFQNSIKDSEQEGGLQMKEIAEKQTASPDLTKALESPQKWVVDKFGIPIEEIIPRVSSRRSSLERSNSFQNNGRVFDYLGRPSSFRNVSGSRSPPTRGLDHLPPAELRNQMPFSYFQPINALPPKPVQRVNSEEDAPPVPVPDYTLHFNRNQMISNPNTPGNKPRIARKPTEEYFKFPPPLKRSVSDQVSGSSAQSQPQNQYYPSTPGVKYVPPVRPRPLAFGVQVYPQNPMTPETPGSDSRILTMETGRI